MGLPLEGKIALITGAAQGIDRATAIALAKEGDKVAICDIAEQLPTATYAATGLNTYPGLP